MTVAALVLLAALAAPSERIVLRVLDANGMPVRGAHVLTIEGTSEYVRQGLTRSDSTGRAVAEVGGDAYVGFQILADGFEPWRLELAPGSPDRKRKVIEVRLLPRRSKGYAVPVVH